jgi:hypothetical protein
MSQGVIKIVTPQMIGGVHRSWINKYNGNLNYGFNIVFEDGTTGICGSEKTSYPLPAGTEVTYDITRSNNGSNNITKIKRLEFAMPEYLAANGKNGGNTGGNGKSSYNDPTTVKKIGFSMCQSISRMFFAGTGRKPRNLEDINGLAGIFYNWTVGDTLETDPHFRDQVSRRYYALQLAVECIPFPGLEISSKEKVIEAAENFLQPLMAFSDEPQF